MFSNTGEPFQGSVIKIGTVLILETWLIMPSMMLLLEKSIKLETGFHGKWDEKWADREQLAVAAMEAPLVQSLRPTSRIDW